MQKPGADKAPLLEDYFPQYQSERAIPAEQLARVIRCLESEVDCLERIGPDRYLSTLSVDAKLDIYLEALAATAEALRAEFYRDADIVTWVEFKLRFAEALRRQMGGEKP